MAGSPLSTKGRKGDLVALARKWQRDAHDRWLAAGQRGIVSAVTGAGKTRLAELCIESFLKDHPLGKVLVIVPTVALADQWVVSLTEDFAVTEAQIGVYAGGKGPNDPRRLNVMVLNTARHAAPRIADSGPTFLVVDECHRAASPENAKALKAEYIATLGISATPDRDYDSGLHDILIPALGELLLTYTYKDARQDGVIAPFELVNVAVGFAPDEEELYDEYTQRIGRLAAIGADTSQLRQLLIARARVAAGAAMRVPASVRLLDDHRDARAIVFHEQIAAADRIHEVLTERGHSSTIYHSRIDPGVRRENLRLYRRGAYDVLVTCRALDEGVNVPATSMGVISSSTASTRQRIQRLGRVLRPAPGKDRAVIYTLYATSIEAERLAAEASKGDLGADTVSWMRVGHPHAG